MPLFRFTCKNCGDDFELLLPRFDAKAICPKCGSNDLERLVNHIGSIGNKSASCHNYNSCPNAGTHNCSCHCGCHHK